MRFLVSQTQPPSQHHPQIIPHRKIQIWKHISPFGFLIGVPLGLTTKNTQNLFRIPYGDTPRQRGDPRGKLLQVSARPRQARTPTRTNSNQGLGNAQAGQQSQVHQPADHRAAIVQFDRLRGGGGRGRWGLRRRTAPHMRNIYLGSLVSSRLRLKTPCVPSPPASRPP